MEIGNVPSQSFSDFCLLESWFLIVTITPLAEKNSAFSNARKSL
jgi:hypothetical protein